jgi:hypothetical protein
LKREIKRAKDLYVRKLVRRLKAGQTDAASDAALRRAKEVDVEKLWANVLDGGGGMEADGLEDEVDRHLAGSKGVVQQLAVVDELREAVEQAERDERAEQAEREGVDAAGEEIEIVEGGEATENVEAGRKGERKREDAGSSSRVRAEENMERNKDRSKEKARAEKKKAKNRMGQRARQRLAEKQYGKDRALHIVENRARDQKRREQQDRKKGKEGAPANHGRSSGVGSRHAQREPKDRKDGIQDDDPASLHPSWQAKKATLKVVIPDISAATTNRTNKIVFDDT